MLWMPARTVAVVTVTGALLTGLLTGVLTGPAISAVSAAPAAGSGSGSKGADPHEGPAVAKTLDNPLAARSWGVYQGPREKISLAHDTATGTEKELLAKIALQPKATWFGGWIADRDVRALVKKHIAQTQQGDPNVLVQMTIFRVRPWNKRACNRLPTKAEKRSYRFWIDEVARAIDQSPVAMVVQPDAPFALCAPRGGKIALKLMRYAVKRFTALPNATVYIEAGAADWLKDDPDRALKILIPAGVELARGFAFNGTHYDSTRRQIRFGAKVAQALAERGIADKKFVINTAQNGKPFKGYTYKGPNYDNARVCKSLTARRCVTLGFPPTTDVTNPAWRLPATEAALAAEYVDAYLWFGRPWLYNQADPFRRGRALRLAATTPYS